jgi:hypothetical protein
MGEYRNYISRAMTYISKEAKFSECGNYRYYLKRVFDDNKPMAMVIGLNPSTADATDDDATISALRRLLEPLGYGGFYMTNLFAWISTDPDDLQSKPNPVGDNDAWLGAVRSLCKDVIFAWGSFKQAEYRIKVVAPKFPGAYVFGTTVKNKPLHPLAVAVWQKKLFNFRIYQP